MRKIVPHINNPEHKFLQELLRLKQKASEGVRVIFQQVLSIVLIRKIS